MLSPEASAEHGKWRNERTPHLIAVMDACGPQDPCVEVNFCCSSQAGKTEVLNNFVGYIMHQDPGPILMIQPNTKPMAEAWSKDRLAPMIRDTKPLTKLVANAKGRDSANTIGHKSFPGGHLTIGGANSPAGLASRPIRYLLFDEIDRYEKTKEGNPIPLAKRRAQTFWNRKIVKVSSPTYEGAGILAELDLCDTLNVLMLPCLDCGELQYPQLKHFVWQDRDVSTAVYVCESCNAEHPISDESRLKMRCEWVALREGEGLRKGFRMNQFASPLANWRDTLQEFLDNKDNPENLKVFVNTVLAEGWEEPGAQADPTSIITRAEEYRSDVPMKALVLSAGIDTQDDRLEVYVYGWGKGEECFAVDAIPLYGDPSHSDVWEQLDAVLNTTYQHESCARLGISAAAIDSGGHHTQMVYDFCATRAARRIVPIKGIGGESKPIIGRVSHPQTGKGRRKVALYPVGVDACKALLFSRLLIEGPGAGYIHIPANNSMFGDEYAAQLTAEKLVTKYRKGFPYREFQKTRPRNEALDCWNYALAALRILNPRFEVAAAELDNKQLELQNKQAVSYTNKTTIRRKQSRYL